MVRQILQAFSGGRVGVRALALCGLIVLANLAAWSWAGAAFGGRPALLALALLAYSFGLRHGADADHIAAIDNVTRRLMDQGQRPVAAGFFFSLGHGGVVVVATAVIALAAGAAEPPLIRAFGQVFGPVVSGLFLFAIAGANLMALAGAWRRSREGAPGPHAHPLPGGPLSRLLARPLRLVRASWHMALLGLLFGLGFDTASEISLMAVSAGQAAHGLAFATVMILPVLFVAGMALIDVGDNLLMLGVYGWALADPLRRRRYDMAVTGLSALLAIVIGGMELVGAAGERFDLAGGVWAAAAAINARSAEIGYGAIILFAAAWIACLLIGRRLGQTAR
jgi:high-affinity nickel-transport protein